MGSGGGRGIREGRKSGRFRTGEGGGGGVEGPDKEGSPLPFISLTG
jgi:hypothetical protein